MTSHENISYRIAEILLRFNQKQISLTKFYFLPHFF
ncbi:hypothetical protein CLOLEP_01081 [[Clostridium] leptum DSM 753]|uniref:Uncharacterized protein n=1 Tax=[Clostridium] leptum DSM 753 TaxID=428125 RepID=A7VR98_9FIRM|nr:hypothetical protein CLOLEP_01081 [[Clostridium] leptum DSM 753]